MASSKGNSRTPGAGFGKAQLRTAPGQGEEPVAVYSAQFAPFQQSGASGPAGNMDLLMDVALRVTAELGRTAMAIKDVLSLGNGSVIELDKLAGDPVDLLVNGTLMARGEVVVVDDNFGVRITEVLAPAKM